MSFMWFSAGLLNDFDSVDANYASQQYSMRTGVAIGYSRATGASGAPGIASKILPETSSTEMWASFYTGVQWGVTPRIGFYNNTGGTLCQAFIDGNLLKAYALVSGTMTLVGTSTDTFSDGTKHQIEIHFIPHPTDGIFQVWVDGILEISFHGNTGTSTGIYSLGIWTGTVVNTLFLVSEIICTNQGRIGTKRMQLLYLSGTGDLNTTEGYMDVLGNTTTTTATSVKTGTYIIPSPAKADGIVKYISFSLTAADTVKVGVFTKNPSSLKFTPDATRQLTLSCLSGTTMIADGNQINNWAIATGEYIGICTAAGTLIYEATSNNNDSNNLSSWYYISDDAFTLATEQTYSTDGAGNFPKAFVQYLTQTNLMPRYNGTIGVLTERPWLESKRYMSLSADGQEFLNQCTDLADSECTSIQCVKITLRGQAGTDILNGQMSIKVDDTITYSDTIAMPGVVNKRHAYLQGSWTRDQINALQIGFKAKT